MINFRRYCVLRLQFATEILLCRHGIEVINAHKDLERLAECAIDIYAMTACLGKSYIIFRTYKFGHNSTKKTAISIIINLISKNIRMKNKPNLFGHKFFYIFKYQKIILYPFSMN